MKKREQDGYSARMLNLSSAGMTWLSERHERRSSESVYIKECHGLYFEKNTVIL